MDNIVPASPAEECGQLVCTQADFVRVFSAGTQLSLCCSTAGSAAVPHIMQHLYISAYFQGMTLTWMKKPTLQ